jgi:hypothetical protein
VTITYPYTPYWYTTTDPKPYITCNGGEYITTSTPNASGYMTASSATISTENRISIGDEK